MKLYLLYHLDYQRSSNAQSDSSFAMTLSILYPYTPDTLLTGYNTAIGRLCKEIRFDTCPNNLDLIASMNEAPVGILSRVKLRKRLITL